MVADGDLERKFCEELQALTVAMPRIGLMIRPHDAWLMLGFLQLALKHPDVQGSPAAENGRRIALRLQELIAPPGSAMHEVAERGWRCE